MSRQFSQGSNLENSDFELNCAFDSSQNSNCLPLFNCQHFGSITSRTDYCFLERTMCYPINIHSITLREYDSGLAFDNSARPFLDLSPYFLRVDFAPHSCSLIHCAYCCLLAPNCPNYLRMDFTNHLIADDC